MKRLNIPYAIDLGNGYTKRTNGESVLVEPSVFAAAPDFFSTTSDYDSFKYHDTDTYYVGNDVRKADLTAIPALGDDDMGRYDSIAFRQLLFAFIAKDFRESVTIPHLVTGLPVNHFKAKADDLKKLIEGSKVISINGEEIIIKVEKVHVLPQPIGTYMSLVNSEKVNPEEQLSLIIDGGHGTLDVTEMKGYTINQRAGALKGVKNAHIDIYNYLVDQFGDMRSISISNIPQLLEKGMVYDGQVLDIKEINEVKDILNKHFDDMFLFVRDNNFDLKSYNNVIFTGGMAKMHSDRIKAKNRNSFIVLDDAQEANVLGYFDYGKAVIEREKESSTVR
ncbi:hypothetical protein V1503_24850 [Bacillus sp. SCS-151]|uniref:ParM/StbA family protein n=1 Tax=Nanhaiella sioensis TaxID=3115293 RepID=UPI003978B790